MTTPSFTSPPTTPDRSSARAIFNAAMKAFFAWFVTHVAELGVFITWATALAAQMAAAASPDALSITYVFDTATADADPGNGKLRLGSATQNAATVIRADLLDQLGSDWTAALDQLDASTSTVKGYIRLVKAADGSKWLLFSVSARAAPSGYRNLTVACVASSSANPFAAGDVIDLEFTRTGDKGDVGAAAWGTVGAWTTSTAYTATAPASVVTQGGETYVCLVSHTSGTFATDLGAGKWVKVAAKGLDGAASAAPDVIVQDQQTSGTNGQSITGGATTVDRTLNTLVRNANSIASLASNVVTLPSGTYYAEARCSFRNFNTSNSVTCKARLYNSTDSAVIADGIAQEANYLVTDSQSTETVMEVRAYFTLASSKGIKLRNMFSGATNCSGGAAMSLGTEVYSELMIWKVA